MISKILEISQATDFDFQIYAHPDDELSHLFKDWVPYYRMKYAICKSISPRSILEIGVRYGYSAITFLNASPDAKYLGIDNDTNTFGGSGGAVHHAEKILMDYNAEIILADSQRMEHFPGTQWDLIHIDGQQDGDGTFHDLELALQKAVWILVDGYFWSDENLLATTFFLKKYRDFIEHITIIPGYAGDLLIKVKKTISKNEKKNAHLYSFFTTEYFEKIDSGADFFKRTKGNDLQSRLLSSFLLTDPKKGMKILDIGCGRGELSYFLGKTGCVVFGIDYSQDAIDIATSTYSNTSIPGQVHYICADVMHHSFTTSFDRIILSNIIEHFEEGNLQALFIRCFKLLSPDGRLIIKTRSNHFYYKNIYPGKRKNALESGCWIPSNPRPYYEDVLTLSDYTPDSLHQLVSSVFPYSNVWVTTDSEMIGSLGESFSEKDITGSCDIHVVASIAEIDPNYLISLISQKPLNKKEINVSITLIDISGEIYANKPFYSTIRIINYGPQRIASVPPNPIHISYHWKDLNGKIIIFDGERTIISYPINPNDERTIMVKIMAPESPGLYELELTLVQEQCFWFEKINTNISKQIKPIKVL